MLLFLDLEVSPFGGENVRGGGHVGARRHFGAAGVGDGEPFGRRDALVHLHVVAGNVLVGGEGKGCNPCSAWGSADKRGAAEYGSRMHGRRGKRRAWAKSKWTPYHSRRVIYGEL